MFKNNSRRSRLTVDICFTCLTNITSLGKIGWVRQLYRKISYPMEEFQKREGLLNSVEGKKIVKTYNKIASVLLEYEVLYHRGW